MKETILLFHSGCPDGQGSKYAFWKKYGDSIEYYPVAHYEANNLPDLTGKNVFLADIAFERRIIEVIEKQANSIIILDHHISRYEELKDKEYYHFTNEHSGAVISWKYLFPDKEVPEILNLVETRDIWKWDYPNANELLSVLDSLPFDCEVWNSFDQSLTFEKEKLIEEYVSTLLKIEDKYSKEFNEIYNKLNKVIYEI